MPLHTCLRFFFLWLAILATPTPYTGWDPGKFQISQAGAMRVLAVRQQPDPGAHASAPQPPAPASAQRLSAGCTGQLVHTANVRSPNLRVSGSLRSWCILQAAPWPIVPLPRRQLHTREAKHRAPITEFTANGAVPGGVLPRSHRLWPRLLRLRPGAARTSLLHSVCTQSWGGQWSRLDKSFSEALCGMGNRNLNACCVITRETKALEAFGYISSSNDQINAFCTTHCDDDIFAPRCSARHHNPGPSWAPLNYTEHVTGRIALFDLVHCPPPWTLRAAPA